MDNRISEAYSSLKEMYANLKRSLTFKNNEINFLKNENDRLRNDNKLLLSEIDTLKQYKSIVNLLGEDKITVEDVISGKRNGQYVTMKKYEKQKDLTNHFIDLYHKEKDKTDDLSIKHTTINFTIQSFKCYTKTRMVNKRLRKRRTISICKHVNDISRILASSRDLAWHTMNEVIVPKFPDETPKQYEKRYLFYLGRIKAFGVLAGVMDILLKYNGILYQIELKMLKGSLNKEQKRLHPIWKKDCPEIPPVVCFTIAEVYLYCLKILKDDFKIDFKKTDKDIEIFNLLLEIEKLKETIRCLQLS